MPSAWCQFVAGMLTGFNGYVWSQSVILWRFTHLACVVSGSDALPDALIYAPHQWRYLFYALFFHGISLHYHQTLIVAAMGLGAIAAAHFRWASLSGKYHRLFCRFVS